MDYSKCYGVLNHISQQKTAGRLVTYISTEAPVQNQGNISKTEYIIAD